MGRRISNVKGPGRDGVQPEKMDQTDGAGSARGPRGGHLRVGGFGPDAMKSGTAKRLRGEWQRAAKVLQAEVNVTSRITTTSERPTPNCDLWELFAGKALASQLSREYQLNSLQPYDLVYGQDFLEDSMQRHVLQVVGRFRPLLTMMGVDCKHYNLFQPQYELF